MTSTRLLPRWIPTLGLVGAPLLLASCTATLFGAWEQTSGPGLVLVLPIAIWEISFGIYMTVKGFRTPVSDPAAPRFESPEPAVGIGSASVGPPSTETE